LFEFVTRTAARRGGASHASVIRSCIEAAAIAEAAQADESRERAA
jgi:hypothetical protein